MVVDVHHYDELQRDPRAHQERFVALWRQVARHYAGHPDGLVLELLNEPSAATSGASRSGPPCSGSAASPQGRRRRRCWRWGRGQAVLLLGDDRARELDL